MWSMPGELVGTDISPQYGAFPKAWSNFVILMLDDLSLDNWDRAFGPTLVDNALFQTLIADSRATTIPQQVRLSWRKLQVKPSRRQLPPSRSSAQTAARSLLAQIQGRSGLTLEEVAPLLGVSRRSLQNWRAQRRISARKEQRLRHLAETLQLLPIDNASNARQILLDRAPGRVRPYDLLAEGRFDAAYTMITGASAPAHLIGFSTHGVLPPAPSVLARLSTRHDEPPSPAGRVDLRRSRRLKR
jgi:hypothetical protein